MSESEIKARMKRRFIAKRAAEQAEKERKRAIEEAEIRRIDEFQHEEKPIPTKVVTVLIKMHGNDTDVFIRDILPNAPSNSIAGGTRVGLCRMMTLDLNYVKLLRGLYKTYKMSVANSIYRSPVRTTELFEDSKPLLKNFFKGTEDELQEEYAKVKDENRIYIMDREYGLMDDDVSQISGIFLIHTTDPSLEPLMIPVESIQLDPFEFDDEGNPEPTSFKAMNEIQQTNLLNVAVASQLGTMNGKITSEYTGIPHYKTIKLTDILKYFGELGIEHVNVIDEGCRVYHKPKPYEYMRRLSFKEKEPYPAFIERTGLGGTRRKKSRKNKIKTKRR